MSDLLVDFEAVRMAGDATTWAPWAKTLSPAGIRSTAVIDADHDAVWDAIARFDGDGWLECADAVRYRRAGGDWIAPVGGGDEASQLDPTIRILTGEVIGTVDGAPATLRIEHIHGTHWRLSTCVEENAGGLAFDERYRGVLKVSDTPGAGAALLRLDLTYRCYWDSSAGAPRGFRFIGFDDAAADLEEGENDG